MAAESTRAFNRVSQDRQQVRKRHVESARELHEHRHRRSSLKELNTPNRLFRKAGFRCELGLSELVRLPQRFQHGANYQAEARGRCIVA